MVEDKEDKWHYNNGTKSQSHHIGIFIYMYFTFLWLHLIGIFFKLDDDGVGHALLYFTQWSGLVDHIYKGVTFPKSQLDTI